MSGAIKAIGKVFRKVVKTVKKIAPFALAAAAVVFTGGAALGALPTFGSAVSGLVGSAGLSGALGTAVTGAITNAGFGAAIGGLTGGTKGMKTGALMGAVTGGLMGPIAGGAKAATTAAGPVVGGAPEATALLGEAGSTLGSAAAASGPIVGAGQGASLLGAAGSSMGAMPAAAAAPAGGLMGPIVGSQGGSLLGNPLVTSQVLQGIGGGLMAKAQARAEERRWKEEQGNYDTSGGTFGGATGRPSNPYANDAQPKWSYDARQGKLVRAG